jgi:hypothetical protein
MVPPACEKMKVTSRYFCDAPENTRLPMVRVVSVPYSTTGSRNSGRRLVQQAADVGCVYTTALRRLSSSITGA